MSGDPRVAEVEAPVRTNVERQHGHRRQLPKTPADPTTTCEELKKNLGVASLMESLPKRRTQSTFNRLGRERSRVAEGVTGELRPSSAGRRCFSGLVVKVPDGVAICSWQLEKSTGSFWMTMAKLTTSGF